MKEPRLLTVKEVAALLRVRRQLVYQLIQLGKLPAFRLGSRYRINRNDLDAFIKNQKNKPKE